MAGDSTTTSRRAILAAAIGGIAASVANALGRPPEVGAADNGPVNIGQENHGTIETGVVNDDGGETAFYGHVGGGGIGLLGESNTGIGVKGTSANVGVWAVGGFGGVYASGGTIGVEGATSSGTGVYGHSSTGKGVEGESVSSRGVYGHSNSDVGVSGQSLSHVGVHGLSGATNRAAIVAQSSGNNTAVLGLSGAAPLATTLDKGKTGIYGEATQDSSSRGVWGRSTGGRGVQGDASSGIGVRGYASSGVGLSGEATTGYALKTYGRVRFDKSGGIATIAAGSNNVVVNPGIDLTATTAVVATLQGSAGGTTSVNRVVIDTAANTFRVYLTANAVANVKVAWLAFG